jgi:hypothetical protein
VPTLEGADAQAVRAARRDWLADRGYRLITIPVAEIEAGVSAVLDRLAVTLGASTTS